MASITATLDTNTKTKGDAGGFKMAVTENKSDDTHYNEWPNTAGFNALGDTRTPVELSTSGRFPSYVAGTLYRTGPGGYKVPRTDPKKGNMSCSHWFDGFATTHKFQLTPCDGQTDLRVMYSSYCQTDELLETARKTGKLTGISFGQKRDPCDTLYQKFKSKFEPIAERDPHLANVGVVLREALPAETAHLSNQSKPLLTVTTDASITKQFDPETLEPLGVTDQTVIHPSLKGQLSASHASRDPSTGDLFNYNIEFGPVVIWRVFRVSAKTGEVEILATLPLLQGAYVHSLLVTDNFVVLCIWPCFITHNGISILWKRNLLEAMSFDPSAKATWLVIDRHHKRGLVKKFTSPAFFCFHTVNAWEEIRAGESDSVDLVCDLVQFANTDVLHKFYYENILSDNLAGVQAFKQAHPGGTHPCLARYRLAHVPLNKSSSPTGSAERILTVPSAHAGDLPSINPRYALRPHRYVWSVLDRGLSSFMDGVVKTDTLTGECLIWDHPKHTPGEPIFVPDPEGEAEDDGVVLTVVLDGPTGWSYLLCLDARNMKEIARADVRKAVGFGFHGLHLRDA